MELKQSIVIPRPLKAKRVSPQLWVLQLSAIALRSGADITVCTQTPIVPPDVKAITSCPRSSWLTIVLSGAAGNALNTLLLESAHRSIGASTAVFAALGLVAGFVWHGRLMAQDRWSYRYGPIVGGLALLMYTGTGGENTDIGAHLLGFVFGFGTGMLLIALGLVPTDRRAQLVAGCAVLALVATAWIVALWV